MALIKCSECGKEFSDRASACPKCGYPIKINKNAEQVDVLCLGGMVAGILSFLIDFFGLISATALVMSIIGFTRANGKNKTFAIVGIACSGIELIFKIIFLISLGY